MALNFLGLGFSFGAKDTGLGSFLTGVDAQFQQITETLKGLYDVADQAPSMSGGMAMASGAGGALSGAAQAAAGLGQVGDAAKAVEGVAGAAEAASAAGDAMSMLGGAGKTGGKMLSSGAFKAVGALGRVAGAAGIVGMAIGPVVAGFGEAVNAVQGFAESVAMALPNAVRRGVAGIQRMNDGINLTNSLEAEAQGLSVSARALGANMGYTGQELNAFTGRATSMAMALNMGSDATAKAIRAFDEAGDELRAMGFESATAVARFTEAFGVDADILRNTGMQMTREFGFTTEQVGELISSTVAYGQASGDVAAALGGLPEMMGHIRSQAAMMGEELDSAELLHHARGAQALATGFFQLGQDSDQARESAMSLSEAMLESRREFQNMFAGTADELPAFAREIAIATGDVESAFEMMSQGPDEFVSGMAGLVQQTRASGGNVGRLMEFVRARFGEAVGPEQAEQLVNFFRNATPEILEMMSATAHASRNLGEMGREAHRTGRTLQESFDRALEGANTALRSVTRRETAEFVRDTGREMRRLGSAFREIGEQEDAMGGIVRLMSRTSQMGQLGLVPERFRTTAVMANQIHENMQPLIDSLTSVGGLIDAAATQAILFGTRVAQNMERAREEMGETADESEVMRRSFDITAQEFADEWISTIETVGPMLADAIEGFAEIDWANLFTPTDESEEGMATGAMGAVQRVIRALGEVDWSGMWDNLVLGFRNLWREIQPWVEETWNEFKTYIIGEIDAQFGEWGQALQDWFAENWPLIILAIVSLFVLTFLAILAALVIATVAMFMLPFILIWMTIIGILGTIWNEWGEEITAYFETLGMRWNTFWSDIGNFWSEVWTDTANFFTETWEGMANWFSELWQGTVQGWEDLWSGIFEFFEEVGNFFREFWQGIADFFTGIWDTISEPINSLIEGARSAFGTLTGIGEDAMNSIGDAAEAVFGNSVNDVVGQDMEATQEVIMAASEASAQAVRDILYNQTLQAITSAFADAYTQVSENTGEFTAGLEEAFTSLGETISSILGQIFLDIVNGSIITMQVAEDAAASIIQNLQSMAAAQRALADARFRAAEALTPEASPEQQEARVRAIEQGPEVIRAIHYPEWYERSGSGYKDLFRNKMDQLIGAVQSGGTGTAATTSDEESRRRREFAQRAQAAFEGRGLPRSAATPSGLRR